MFASPAHVLMDSKLRGHQLNNKYEEMVSSKITQTLEVRQSIFAYNVC